MWSCETQLSGRPRPAASLRFSTMPLGVESLMSFRRVSQLKWEVKSISRRATMVALRGIVLGREKRILVWRTGKILMLSCGSVRRRVMKSCWRVTGATRDTRSADRRGLTPLRAESLPKDSRRLRPDGIPLVRYPTSGAIGSVQRSGSRLADAEKTTEGL